MRQQSASNETEEDTAPSIAAFEGTPSRSSRRSKPIDYRDEFPMHSLDALVAVHQPQLPLPRIVVNDLDGLPKKEGQALLDRFSGIVGSLVELASIEVADASDLRWPKRRVIDVLTGA